MGKNKDKKKNLVKVVAPQLVTQTETFVIAFAFWQTADLPKEVVVEVIEIDRESENDDNFTTAEDVVVRYGGTLISAADDTAELTNIKVLDVTSPSRSPDKLWIRFANQADADVIEAGIPFSPAIKASSSKKNDGKEAEHSANEGSFYELAVVVREGPALEGTVLVTSAATAVRQRAFVLLAVEPLPQNNSSMTHLAGVRILETFHPGEVDLHQPRNWDNTVLRIRDRFPMNLGNSGCSYVIVTMLLRYLRIDDPAAAGAPGEQGAETLVPQDATKGTTVRLFDHHIKLPDLEATPAHKPRFFKEPKVAEAAAEKLAEQKQAFIDHFVHAAGSIGDKDRKKLIKKLGKFFDEQTEGKEAVVMVAPHSAENVDESECYEPASRPITAQDYVPLMVWRLHVLDDRSHTYALRRYDVNHHRVKLEGASDYRALKHEEHTQWIPQFDEVPLEVGGKRLAVFDHMEVGERGKSSSNDDGILIPMSSTLLKTFGMIETAPYSKVVEFGDNEPGDATLVPWQRYFVRTLERGVPLVGLFSPGQYASRDSGGHFCLVVGYRYRADPNDPDKKKIRFIINDPAGGRTHQYEAHDEEELNPEGVDPTAVLKPKNTKLGMERERRGLNLIIERRKRLSIREVRVYEPGANGTSSWNPGRHSRFLFFRGKVQGDVGG